MKKLILTGLAAALVSASAAFAQIQVDPKLKAYQPTSGVSGNLNSIGSDTLNNLMTLWAEGFRAIYPNVNIQIEGLELDVRRALVNKFKYLNPAARYLPAVRLGRWDGKVAYFQLGGSTYVNLLPEIVPILDQYGYDIELDDRRTYSTKFEFALMAEDTFSDRTWPPGHERAEQTVVLRDYQVEIINEFLNNPQS
jgi:hypothetical protein